MRRGWIFVLLAAAAGAQEFSEDELDRAILAVGRGDIAAVRRIATWGPRAARATAILVRAWTVPVPGFAAAADAALLSIGPGAIPGLAQELEGKLPAHRRRAAALLEQLAREPRPLPVPIEQFFPYLRDADMQVRYTVGRLLTARGAEGEKPFFELLDDEDPEVRRWAAVSLSCQGVAVMPRLVPLLSHKSPRRRAGAAHAIGCMVQQPESALSPLVAAAGDPDVLVRTEVLFALAQSPSMREDVVQCLFGALADRAESAAASAVFGLQQRGAPVVPRLIEAWDGDDRVARHATESLARIGDKALAAVAEALRSGGPRRKRFAATCLGRMAGMWNLPVDIAPALADADAEVRLAAADALGLAPQPVAAKALDALLAVARAADPRVRPAAVAAVSRAAPEDPRVTALLGVAKNEADLAMKLAVAAAGAHSAEPWIRILSVPAAPAAAKLLAAERIRGMQAPGGALFEPLARVVTDDGQAPEVRAAAVRALDALASRRLFEVRYDPRLDVTTRPSRAAADKALKWLAGTQQDDGRWTYDGFADAHHDVGLTGLALLAFLASGQTGADAFAPAVPRGFKWLVSKQTPEGLFRDGPARDHTLLEHAIATHALCEWIGMTGDDTLREQAQKAADACTAARGTWGWRYVPGGPESDTNVTTWMVVALRVAEEIGLWVDTENYETARRWVDSMTEPNFGQVGYQYPGGQPFRPPERAEKFPPDHSHSMTACGLLCRLLLGEDPKAEIVRKGVELCGELPPAWKPEQGAIDMYFWHYGSLVLFQVGGAPWKKWNEATVATLVKNQHAKGSWAPLCVWGEDGGTVYATSLCALTLLAPWRYPRGWPLQTKPSAAYAAARAALDVGAACPYDCVRAPSYKARTRWPGR